MDELCTQEVLENLDGVAKEFLMRLQNTNGLEFVNNDTLESMLLTMKKIKAELRKQHSD